MTSPTKARGFQVLAVAAALLLVAHGARAKSIADARKEVVQRTMDYLNVPYLWGGDHPKTGLDCSSFVRRVYGAAGLGLPRTSREQFAATASLKPDQVLPGDLVFFAMKHPGTAKVDHVGVYVGRGYFVHAGVSTGVHIDAIARPYWMDRLVGVRKFKGF